MCQLIETGGWKEAQLNAFECVRRELFKQIFGGLECVGHSFANVALFVFLRDV